MLLFILYMVSMLRINIDFGYVGIRIVYGYFFIRVHKEMIALILYTVSMLQINDGYINTRIVYMIFSL